MDFLAREKTIKTTFSEFFRKSSFTCESKIVYVIMTRLDILLQPLVTCKRAKIRKDKIIIFYSFPNFTFTFLPKTSSMYFDFHLWSLFLWSKSPYVILTFDLWSFSRGPKILMYFYFHLWSFSCRPKVLMYFWLYLWSFSCGPKVLMYF